MGLYLGKWSTEKLISPKSSWVFRGISMVKHCLSMLDIEEDLGSILGNARILKEEIRNNGIHQRRYLDNKVMAMIFEKPSTRTRLS